MFKLNNELLEELGLGSLPAKEKNTMLKHIYDTLEQRVGIKLAEMMSNQQMFEFEQMMPLPTLSRTSNQFAKTARMKTLWSPLSLMVKMLGSFTHTMGTGSWMHCTKD